VERLEARVGATINDKYQLDALLGVGGMAAVYAATHRNGSRVALKVLHAELARATEIRARFLREGYAANKVGHPGVVRVHDDAVAPDGTVFLVMDLLQGKTLEEHRVESGGRLPVPQALRIGGDVLDILSAAHQQRIVHRDIKPDNVFLTTRGETKLMDFGIARLLDAARMTGSGAIMGTPAFMSPEQAGSENKRIDAPSDVWSTGAVLFLLLTGEEVHRARTGAEQMIFAATQPARSVATAMPSLPASLAEVIDVSLRFEMKDRFQTAAAMANALRHVVHQHCLQDASLSVSQQAAAFVASSETIAAVPSAPARMPTTPTLIHGSGKRSPDGS